MKTARKRVGVIVGRFQVDRLHRGHRALLESVLNRHEEVLVVVGSAASEATDRNPLNFAARRQLILETFPTVTVAELVDCPSDEEWSARLDRLVRREFPRREAILYGSRDSFLQYYSGRLKGIVMPTQSAESGTARRRFLQRLTGGSKDFRQGIINYLLNRRPIVYPTVDIAIVNEDRTTVLLGQKKIEGGKWRFLGGFVDSTDNTILHAARREALEETGFGLELGDFTYIGTTQIDDWRYRGSSDCIMTTFFRATRLWGKERANDDIDRLRWFPLDENLLELLVEAHQPLGQLLLATRR